MNCILCYIGKISRLYFCLWPSVCWDRLQHARDSDQQLVSVNSTRLMDQISGQEFGGVQIEVSCKCLIFSNKCDGRSLLSFLEGGCLLFTYMGVELTTSWTMELAQHQEAIRGIHGHHNQSGIRKAKSHFVYFTAWEQCGEYLVHTGTCVVHQLLHHPKNKCTKTAVTKCAKHSPQRRMHAHALTSEYIGIVSICPSCVTLKWISPSHH